MRGKYVVESCGDCMGDLVPAGTVLFVEPGEEIRPGDLVMLVFDLSAPGPWAKYGETIATDGHSGCAKIFLSAYRAANGETMGLFGQLNPPAVLPIPMNALLAVDRVNFHAECTGLECEAIAMLQAFIMAPVEQKEAA
jgi:hypothetical protein